MPSITILKRQTGKVHLTSVDEANDTVAISGLVRTAAGAASLYTDGNTTSITIGASGTPVTVDDNLIISGEVRGPSDGSGVVIGQTGGGASTGSALQLQSFTNVQRDFLVAADGMCIYNSDALTVQVYDNGAWENVPGQGEQGITPGEVTLGGILDYPSSGGPSASEIQYARVFLTAGQVYDRMKYFQESGGNPTRNVNLGIYDQATPASPTGTPDTRVAETGSTATASGDNGTYVTVNLTTPYTVTTTGFYWLSIISDSVSVKYAVSLTYRQNFLPTRREAGTGSTLPATTGTLTNASSAVIYVALLEQ